MLVAVVLGLVAAFLFALAAVVQQQATRAASREDDQPSAPGWLTARLPVLLSVLDLLRSPLWLLGWGTNLAGFAARAAALHLGSVALVQPLLVMQLVFTLPLVAVRDRHWPRLSEWVAGASICAGIVVFLSVRGAAPTDGSADRTEILLATGATLLLVVVLVGFSYGR